MHPYQNLPQWSYWKSGVTNNIWGDLDFKPNTKFKLDAADDIATAGSCFAQHLARNLDKLGLKHKIYEMAPSIIPEIRARELQYGIFSARYGNVYTARQLRQVIEFAFGFRDSVLISTATPSGVVDLLRPGVQSEGFDSLHDLELDRFHHFACVKQLFLNATCFIFTLGLTEAWWDQESGVVFPVCPGTKAGSFDPARHKFVNFSALEVYEDLHWCIEFVKKINPGLRWIFTVSPVALAATASENHVVVATMASKAKLLVAADMICSSNDHCDYFPSFEIVSSTPTFGQFLDGDLRNISERGVNVVMRIFRNSFIEKSEGWMLQEIPSSPLDSLKQIGNAIANSAQVECEEAFNDPNAG